MLGNSFELINQDYGLLSSPRSLRSIRLKEDSFLSIRNAWNKAIKTVKNFEVNRTENKLNKAREEFKNLEFSPRDFNEGLGNTSVAEEKIMKKSKAIARLEEKVSILRDIPVSLDFVNNRAIKLKDNMIRNARFNSHNVYSIPEESKDAIFAAQDVSVSEKGSGDVGYRSAAIDEADRIILEETENTARSVQELMNDNSANDANVRDDIVVVPDRVEVKKTVDDEFSRQEGQYSSDEMVESMRNEPIQISREEVEEVVNSDEVRAAVDEAINGIDVSRNGAFGAKIEKYADSHDTDVNDNAVDGTYRLTKDQIDEDFRKTPIDTQSGISRIEDIKASIPKIDVSQIFGRVNNGRGANGDENTSVIPLEQEVIEEKSTVDNSSDDQIHFDYDDESINALTAAVDKADSMDDIQALLARVKQLKEKQNESKIKAMQAKEKAAESEAMKRSAEERLKEYESALKEDLGYNERSAAEDMEKARNNEALVEAMLSMIQPTNEAEVGKRK